LQALSGNIPIILQLLFLEIAGIYFAKSPGRIYRHTAQKSPKLSLIYASCGCRRPRPDELCASAIQTSIPQPKSILIPCQAFEFIAPIIAEQKQIIPEGIHFEFLTDYMGQSIHRFSEIHGFYRQIYGVVVTDVFQYHSRLTTRSSSDSFAIG